MISSQARSKNEPQTLAGI
ncbi:hypothetical protein [Rhizobium ruizarguesonis]